MKQRTTYPMDTTTLGMINDLGVKLDTYLTGSYVGNQQVVEIQGDDATLAAFSELYVEMFLNGANLSGVEVDSHIAFSKAYDHEVIR